MQAIKFNLSIFEYNLRHMYVPSLMAMRSLRVHGPKVPNNNSI